MVHTKKPLKGLHLTVVSMCRLAIESVRKDDLIIASFYWWLGLDNFSKDNICITPNEFERVHQRHNQLLQPTL